MSKKGQLCPYIDKEGCISLSELSKYNGESELANAKTIVLFLAMKAEVYDIPQTIRFTSKDITK